MTVDIKTHLAFEDLGEVPLAFFKYKSVRYAKENLPKSLNFILDRMLDIMPKNDMNLVVDYKVRDLKKGESGCPLSGWHIDCTTNPNHNSRPDTHLIFSTQLGTEFVTSEMFDDGDTHFSQALERNPVLSFIRVKPNTITEYNRFNLHRSPKMEKDCRRILLRLTQTEIITNK